MSIETRIQAINDHLIDDYKVLRLAGADLTGVNKNIVNLKMSWKERLLYFMNNGTQDIWNNWTKVSGTGTSLTLNNTEEAPMSLTYKGNTEQTQYTGKNLIDYSMVDANYTQLYDTGYYKLTFPGNKKILEGAFEENTQYTLSFMGYRPGQDGNGGGFNIVYTDSTQDMIRVNTSNATSYNIVSNANKTISYVFVTWGSTNISYLKDLQLEKGNTKTDFEPYVGGIPSPSPSYPQPIQVVSGDNKVKVEGTNLFSVKDWLDTLGATYTENSDGSITFQVQQNLYNTTYPIKPTDRCLWSFKAKNGTGGNFRFRYVYEDGYINETAGSGTGTSEVSISTSSSTGHGNVVGIRANWTTAGTFTIRESMLEQYVYGVSPRPYEPYEGQTFPINLGVENLVDFGTQSFTTYKEFTGLNIKAGTYTFSTKITSSDTSQQYSRVYFYGSTSGVQSFATLNRNSRATATITTNFDIVRVVLYASIDYASSNGKTATYEDMQLELGDKANSFTPYGTTPIELLKIGTYQDKIDKSTGKNLISTENIHNGSFTTIEELQNETYTETSNTKYRTIRIENLPAGTYTLKINWNKTARLLRWVGDDTLYTTGVDLLQNQYTFTTTTNGLFGLSFRSTDSTNFTDNDYNIMLNEGTTALEYEPYGTSWYVNKQIGKVVLDGSESWYKSSATSMDRFGVPLTNIGIPATNTYQTLFINYFTPSSTNTIGSATITSTDLVANYSSYGTTTLADFKTWLSTHNTIVYYVLATPTATEITDATLISQLEALKKSYEGQTNISQVNNDLPFELNITALSNE